jgi:hypothetical protein
MPACVRTCIRIIAQTNKHAYIHIHLFIHAHTHTHTHIHEHEVSWNAMQRNNKHLGYDTKYDRQLLTYAPYQRFLQHSCCGTKL